MRKSDGALDGGAIDIADVNVGKKSADFNTTIQKRAWEHTTAWDRLGAAWEPLVSALGVGSV